MQRARYLRLSPKAGGPPERRDIGILQSVSGILRVPHDAQSDSPHPIFVSRDEQGKRIRVAIDVCAQQRGIVYGVPLGLTLDHCASPIRPLSTRRPPYARACPRAWAASGSETGRTADRTMRGLVAHNGWITFRPVPGSN